MAFELPPLPYDKSAFGEILSAETFDFHWGKHHRAYVNKTNELAPQAGLDGRRLSEVIRAAKESGNKGLFNNSAQLWNHSFYWQCLSPETQQPTGTLKQKIEEAFGSTDALLDKLKTESVNHFASGWGWLVLDGDQLKVTSLHDGDSPVAYDGMKPLLTIDVWEHAYYIDYRNMRADYVDALLRRAINWDFVAQNLDGQGVSRADQ
ncbi:superoxide dismutase [Fe] [Sphingomonas sp. MAH-20]|uniref:Superoxide dismutase n=1 Tax=Sphingomonas horti TaxID=2682842 RepID=A0A6I4J204_9SPHN|nr:MULTISPECIES: superoxide dismutase [Sphingomonas]MBA2919849.1 superoxide dismutase [Sphingomonas sp. CGMCC 1.13658]MVO78088.1 superoxide dismutase [Fe] [Sphingomonas horti]